MGLVSVCVCTCVSACVLHASVAELAAWLLEQCSAGISQCVFGVGQRAALTLGRPGVFSSEGRGFTRLFGMKVFHRVRSGFADD